MKIDRAGFLLLATSLASSACIINNSSDGDADGGGGQAATGGSAQGGSGQGGDATGGSGGDATGGSAQGGSAQGGAGGSGGGTCDDSMGQVLDCAPAASSTCGSFAQTYCEGGYDVLKPAVAEAAAQCLIDLGTGDCLAAYQCRVDALANACPDSTTDADCAAIVAACNAAGDASSPIDAETCKDYYDGLNATGRQQMLDCATVGDNVFAACEFGIYSCAEGL